MPRALIWDVDGTLAETERDGHRVAFNQAFAELGLPWRWSVERYRELLAVPGGRQRLLHDLAARADAPRDDAGREALARELHRRKTLAYTARVTSGALTLRPGVRRLIDEARCAGATLAIATTTSRANVDALLGQQLGPRGAGRFAAVVCADDAPRLKPDPQAYVEVLQRLRLAPDEALAVEDSPAGFASAAAAGIEVLVTRSECFETFDPADALACCNHLDSEVRPREALAAEVAAAAAVSWGWLCQAHAAAVAASSRASGQNRQPRPMPV